MRQLAQSGPSRKAFLRKKHLSFEWELADENGERKKKWQLQRHCVERSPAQTEKSKPVELVYGEHRNKQLRMRLKRMTKTKSFRPCKGSHSKTWRA